MRKALTYCMRYTYAYGQQYEDKLKAYYGVNKQLSELELACLLSEYYGDGYPKLG